MFSWLVIQIFAFYALVAYGIALCGAYLCWEAETEEKKLKEALEEYMIRKSEERGVMEMGNDNEMRERLLK